MELIHVDLLQFIVGLPKKSCTVSLSQDVCTVLEENRPYRLIGSYNANYVRVLPFLSVNNVYASTSLASTNLIVEN